MHLSHTNEYIYSLGVPLITFPVVISFSLSASRLHCEPLNCTHVAVKLKIYYFVFKFGFRQFFLKTFNYFFFFFLKVKKKKKLQQVCNCFFKKSP